MDLVLAICQGLGLALAIGIGGALVALFVSAMGSLEAGFNPDGTDYGFITATWFLVMVLAVVALSTLARGREVARVPVAALLGAAGALAFAASLAEEGETAWPGLFVGALVAGAAALVSGDVLEGAVRRAKAAGAKRGGVGRDSGDASPEADAANVLIIGFAAAGIIVAALALFVPPVSLLAAVALAALALGRRRKAGEKYEGLRILR